MGLEMSAEAPPAVSSDGNVAAARWELDPLTGGVPGIFVAGQGGRVRPFLRIGENGAPGINGRIVSCERTSR